MAGKQWALTEFNKKMEFHIGALWRLCTMYGGADGDEFRGYRCNRLYIRVS